MGGLRADHDHRHGFAFHDQLEEGEARHARHVEIEGHDVDLEIGEAIAGVVGVGGATDELDVFVLAEDIGEDAAEERGVVHDKDANAAARVRGGEVAIHVEIFRKMLGLICFRPRGFWARLSAWPMMR